MIKLVMKESTLPKTLLGLSPCYPAHQDHCDKDHDNHHQSILGWEGKDIVANSSEIVYEGKLKVRTINKRPNKLHNSNNRFVLYTIIIFHTKVGTDKKKLKERYVVLCDGLLIVCSQNQAVSSNNHHHHLCK